MANERVPLQKGKVVDNAVSVFVGGKAFNGWEQVTITKSIESIAYSFKIDLFDKFTGLSQDWPLRPGLEAKVRIGKETVITGRIESLDVSYSDEERGSYSVSGRSKAGDLVDCMWTGDNEYQNISLTKFAKTLTAPFGIQVFESVVPSNIDKVSVKPGETIFEVLNRQARLQGLLFISTREGNIRLTRAARARASSSLEQGVNILDASATYDNSERHNRYIVKGQSKGTDEFFGANVSEPEGEATDNGITRHRPLVIIADGNVDDKIAKTRAQWEASSRLARAIRVNVAVQGWAQASGDLWDINQIIAFKSSFLGVNRKFLISEVTHSLGKDEGKTTSLVLVDPQSYDPQPVVNKDPAEDDIISQLKATR